MARIPYYDPANASEDYAKLLAKLPQDINVMRMLSHAEPELKPFLKFTDAILRKSAIRKWYLELALLRVGHLSKAAYEIHQHEHIAKGVGGTPEKIAAIAEGATSPVFDEHEKEILRYTDDVVQNVRASDYTFVPLSKRHTHQEMIELTMGIGCYMMVSRLLNTFDVEIEEGGDKLVQIPRD